jgi:hypothetical protein
MENKAWWVDSSGRIELEMTLAQAKSCFHPGPCDSEVLELSENPLIAKQIDKIDPKIIANCLKEYGAWDEDELSDHSQNIKRLLWIAACDIAEEA